jgi:hypothetical protein
MNINLNVAEFTSKEKRFVLDNIFSGGNLSLVGELFPDT